jgi:IclR family transcriptional regulator, acetate operon repressor
MSAPEAWHVTRTLRAMELLAIQPRSAPELADALGVHVRTARRVLKRLESEGYVTVTEDRRRRYRPTMRVVALAGQVVERAELTAKAVPHAAALRGELGAGCHLCVPSHLFALCLVHAPAGTADTPRPQLRELVPCHCTAAGKALLAWREPWREVVLEQRLESFTDRTTVGPETLRRELARTVARGYAVEDREYEPDTRALAAPVFSDKGEAVAALAVAAPVSRLPAERYGEIGAAVVRAAGDLSSELGFEPQAEEGDDAAPGGRARAA